MSASEILWSFEGRISRRTYCLWKLIISSSGVALAAIPFLFPHAVTGLFANGDQPLSALDATVLLILIVVGIVACALFIWISMALDQKRWHDMGKSGSSLGGAIPYLGIIVSIYECFCLPGTDGPNHYGPVPR